MAAVLRASAFLLLLLLPSLCLSSSQKLLNRQKREWIVAPRQLRENNDYTGLESIAHIRSDKETNKKVSYYLSGPGVDEPPVGVFSVDRYSGLVKIHSILDREYISVYKLKGTAKFSDGTPAEKELELKIVVTDVNDNAPVVQSNQVGSVNESCKAGTVVMTVIATDADEENTLHSKIYYSIEESSNPGGMFSINYQTGQVSVRKDTLDRELKDVYKLMIRVTDMNGQSFGMAGQGEVLVNVLDINDNVPTLEKESYEASIEENTVGMEVLRIKAIDMDLIHTDNWLAAYTIVSGNEHKYFTIVTDTETNEGIIKIVRPLDYETLKVLNLGVVVANKAEYSKTIVTTSPKRYPIKIHVVNQKEGPRFDPTIKVVSQSEDITSTTLNKVITTYAALDSDTLMTATNVRYAKLKDDDNWLIVDPDTADIRLTKIPDRESKSLVNGTYYAEIICITNDFPTKTATGTIAIVVEDHNDHCPQLTATTHTMCMDKRVIYVTAVDEDETPFSAPFEFKVVEGSGKEKWRVEQLNGTTAILTDLGNLWPGIYQVAVEVKDQEGLSCDDVQVMDVTVCTCAEHVGSCLSRGKSTSDLGVGGILLMLLGLLLLLLVPLLLMFCLCGGASAVGDFKPIPFGAKQQLMSEHTEGLGEDKEVPLLHIPVEVDHGQTNANANIRGGFTELGGAGGAYGGGFGGAVDITTRTEEEVHHHNQYRQWLTEQEEIRMGQAQNYYQGRGEFVDGMALSHQFLGQYYAQKSQHNAEQSELKDALLVYDYEGCESLAGSVGCCSLLEQDNDLSYLDDLGPKFKTLAEICQGSKIVSRVVDTGVSLPPVSPVRPSTHTHLHTHTETIREKDRVSASASASAVDTSNVATGSSTIVQEQHFTERSNVSATLPKVHVQDKIMVPSQTLLIQQPAMYYAAAPMYVVESQSPKVLLVGGTQQQAMGQVDHVALGQVGHVSLGQVGHVGMGQVGHVGMGQVGHVGMGQVGHVGMGQGLVQVAGLQGSQGMVLVDSQVGVEGVAAQVGQGLSQGTMSRKVLLVENGASGLEQGEHLVQGFIKTAPQRYSGRFTQGAAGQAFEVRGPSVVLSSSSSVKSHKDAAVAAAPKVQGSQKVVVQHKKVSVTERNVESNTRA